MKNIIIASTSTIHGEKHLEYLLPELSIHFKDCKTLLFIPFARPGGISHDEYTELVATTFKKINIKVQGIHELEDPIMAIKEAEAIFTGGGNTFVLVSQLYAHKIMSTITEVVKNGTPYLGTSAGSNICGLSMQTTNDMPIVYPPSFQTLGLVPFNINPHYLDTDTTSKHMGETRETRINEFHAFNAIPVIGLREGSWIEVRNSKIKLRGTLSARLFRKGQAAVEMEKNSDLTDLK
ncbi:dipeptidase PepE [Flavobacterium algicola]|uniref:dipeptidase PepE n=1 Tax=Flavobacterium algicola TaxID=556529 RepID=UPI001EFEBB55|nr:dipeptidase PepE [Flavobacterium algicola]MCG9791410.1 dipeptidase PepE [Flavobacterium algicola]